MFRIRQLKDNGVVLRAKRTYAACGAVEGPAGGAETNDECSANEAVRKRVAFEILAQGGRVEGVHRH